MATTTKTVTLKLLVDKQGHKVLFAEASKEFVDFLFYVLSWPVATVINLITKKGMVGCLGNLYESIEKLSTNYIQPNFNKDCILKPKVNLLMLPNVDRSTTRKKFYRCPTYTCRVGCAKYISDDPSAKCPSCNCLMYVSLTYVAPCVSNTTNSDGSSSAGENLGYVKGVTYIVMDDLAVKPMSTISSVTLLNSFNIKNTGLLEEREITFGKDEAVKLIKTLLESKTVLTDVFLGKKRSICSA